VAANSVTSGDGVTPLQYVAVSLAGMLRYAFGRGGAMLNPGDAAPDFEVKDHTGRTRKLSDYRGRKVVLWFYPKADTPG